MSDWTRKHSAGPQVQFAESFRAEARDPGRQRVRGGGSDLGGPVLELLSAGLVNRNRRGQTTGPRAMQSTGGRRVCQSSAA